MLVFIRSCTRPAEVRKRKKNNQALPFTLHWNFLFSDVQIRVVPKLHKRGLDSRALVLQVEANQLSRSVGIAGDQLWQGVQGLQ